MKKIIYITTLLLVSIYSIGKADKIVFQAIDTIGKHYEPVPWSMIDKISVVDSLDNVYLKIMTKDNVLRDLNLEEFLVENGNSVPLLIISTDEPLEQIPDKINYKDATIKIKGFGEYEDFENSVQIRGRGNTSWIVSDKKPYRLKFGKKQELCGLKKSKNYVLTANYTDISLLQNPIASFIGKMLDLPFTHTMVPVDVILNGIYRGSYLLTNKPGINSGSVDIDEIKSVMWEIDKNYDEEIKFRSPVYDLPVMLSDPDMDEERFEFWKADFEEMEKAVSEGNVEDYIDIDEYARYRIVYDVLRNGDLYIPKSLKMYKTEGGKYIFGPIWDFDSAMGYEWGSRISYDSKWAFLETGFCPFMQKIEKDPKVKELIAKYTREFLEREEELWRFIEELEKTMETSAERNNIRWKELGSWKNNVILMKNWLGLRLEYLKSIYLPDSTEVSE